MEPEIKQLYKDEKAIYPIVNFRSVIDDIRKKDLRTIILELEESLNNYILNTDKTLDNKVDKVLGKGLSSNDFTDKLKEKLENYDNYNDTELREKLESLTVEFNTLLKANPSKAIESFNDIIAFLENIEDDETLSGIIAGIETQIGNINSIIETLATKEELTELENNVTSDLNTINNLLEDKVDKVDGKGLSTNDFTDEYKDKLLESSSSKELTKEEFDALEVKESNKIYIVTDGDKKDVYIGEEQINKNGLEVVKHNTIECYIKNKFLPDSEIYSSRIYLDKQANTPLNSEQFELNKINVVKLIIRTAKETQPNYAIIIKCFYIYKHNNRDCIVLNGFGISDANYILDGTEPISYELYCSDIGTGNFYIDIYKHNIILDNVILIEEKTQAEYDALETKDNKTFYIID